MTQITDNLLDLLKFIKLQISTAHEYTPEQKYILQTSGSNVRL